MNKKQNLNKSLLIISSLVIFGIILGSAGFYVYNEKQKSPLERTYKISNTDVHIKTVYNNKYNTGRLDITIDEPIEDWQIKAIGYDETYITLECETADKTVKKEYIITDIPLIKGEKITGNLIFENLALKDYAMMKELLSGDITIETPKYLTLDLKERDNLQQEFYKNEQNKIIKAQNKAAAPKNNSSFFNTLFDFN
ncbi:MAG: hypothetical protein NC191_02165 [Muribaculaceae bacterium]|nr:hypothetical protein [Muribaculaceae bacterium]